MDSKNLSIRDITYIGLFTALTAICAQISIPLPGGVPFTLQTFAIQLTAVILGAKKGALAAVIYILLGAIGLPVFSRFMGGVGVIAGPTGGFILSFPIMAFIVGAAASKNTIVKLGIGLFVGMIVNFACGMLFFTVVMSSTLQAALFATVLPFIPFEIIQISFLAAVGLRIKSAIKNPHI
ncbi:MAG: biotin transporter BioY [Defluviitaleaceae bacterium]|nr:biotin transporter BioY [Defluviitaleaceae bacterium]